MIFPYALGTMHQPTGMTDQSSAVVVSGAQYGVANELLALSYAGVSESRTYNNLFQMTAMTVGGQTTQYTFPAAGQNNGKIVYRKDVASGEEVQYSYDALNRLIAASTTAASDAVMTAWGQGFGYDGFGNLTSKTVTKGSAPVMTLAVNPLTNRITGQGYDANGNLLSLPAGGTGAYDAENRLVAVPGATYGYDGSNKRIWRWTGSVDGYGFGNASGLQLYLCWVDGKQWGTYVTSIYTNTGVQMAPLLLDSVGTLNVYFRGKKVGTGQAGALVAFVQDRLGSSVKTYPYGEEKVPNGVDGWKFATYLRDTATNLDYADQRFYANTQGRFLSADPYAASGGAGDPGSWNRYAYVQGDPVNFKDSSGLFVENTSSCGAPGTDYCMDADTLQIWGDMGSLSIGGFTMSIAFLQAGNGPQQGGGGSLTPGPPSCAESVERLYGSLDANEVAAVSVILGENSWVYLGKNQYQDGERYGRGSLSPLGVEDVFLEDQYMADVLINRTERSGRSLASVASAQGQFLGYVKWTPLSRPFLALNKLMLDGVVILELGRPQPQPPVAIPALESALGAHPCGALSSVPVPSV